MTVDGDRPGTGSAAVDAGPAADVPPPADGLEWRRVHPVTPAVKGWKVLAVVLVIVAQQVSQNVREAQDVVDSLGWVWVLVAMGVVVLVGFLYSVVAWRMTRYAVDAEAVYLQTGILFRQQRSARLDRIQAIDVVQPVLARILGLAELRIEVAGGADSAVRLSYLKDDRAQEVRNEILARAAGVSFGTPDQPVAPTAPEREVLHVPPGRLIESLLRSSVPFWALVAVGGAVALAILVQDVGPLFGFLPALIGTIGYLWQRFVGEFGFRAALSPDGIRMRRGLLETQSQTLPPGRVQAVRLTQPLLWRSKDWWRIQVNVAGYQSASGDQSKESLTVLLPVGDRSEALTALWLVLPDLGTHDPEALLDAALTGDGDDGGFTTSPRPARWLDPIAWRRNGFVVTDRALLARSGRLVRRLVVVPHERTQSLGLAQGPLQRKLGLASFTLHSVPGPVVPVVAHLDVGVAGRLMGDQADRARTARRAAGPERWMAAMAAEEKAVQQSGAPVGVVEAVLAESPVDVPGPALSAGAGEHRLEGHRPEEYRPEGQGPEEHRLEGQGPEEHRPEGRGPDEHSPDEGHPHDPRPPS